MKVVEIRSPFIIQVNEPTQLGSKIEVFIWRNGDTEPTTPTYTLSKPIPTTNQRLTSYNVSNFVKEFVDNVAPQYPNWVGFDYQENYALFRVKRYWDNAGVYTLLDSTKYVGVNGFTQYMDGIQYAENTRIKLLFNPEIKNNYQIQSTYPDNTIQYLNVLVEFNNYVDFFNVTFNQIGGAYDVSIDFDGLLGIYLFKIPISLAKVDNNFVNGCEIVLTYLPDGGSPTIFSQIYTYPICEPKYTPVLCDFINRHGGWQTLTFYKAQTNTVTSKSDEYKLMPDAVEYNPLRGQSKSFNIQGSQNVILNTGWVNENYSELITDLLLSETILLDRKPANLKTQSSELKTKLKNRMINYTLEFEYNFNLINDVI